MAWTTPPTFSYGYPASVDDMNIIRNNLLYLYGQMFATASASQETEVKVDSPYDEQSDGGVAYVGWVEHHEDNLYYRIRVKSETTTHSVRLYVGYYEDPFAFRGDEMGRNTESQTLTLADTYYNFTNGDVAVDISGWGLSYGEIYKVVVALDATTDDGSDCWIETNFIYEMA